MSRYSLLTPFSIEEAATITRKAIEFFNPLNNEKINKILTGKITGNQITPLTILDFIKWYRLFYQVDLFPKQQNLKVLLTQLTTKGLFVDAGGFDLNKRLLLGNECSTTECKGDLYIGKYLGLRYVAHKITYNLVRISGLNENGDINVGTGILLSERFVLTCAHVVNDMKVDDCVEVNGKSYLIERQEAHTTIDFAVILLKEPVKNFCRDLALRSAMLLEKILIAGFPKVPTKTDDKPLFQSGEIAASINSYNNSVEIFTAIARPGNSGGPLLSEDGKVLGIVSANLEDNALNNIAYFSAIPSRVIYELYNELAISRACPIPWEEYT